MRVMVTGAGGFAGGHIARRLAEQGFDVVAATRSSAVEPPRTPEAARRFQVLRTALEDSASSFRNVDAVVHAAATSIWTGISVDRMLTDNVAAMQALVRNAVAAKARTFVFLSSISAFGTIRAPVLTEAEASLNVDAYGATKLLGELLLQDVAAALPSLSIRLPAVIGRGSRRNWPSECLRKLKADEPLQAFNPNVPFNNVIHEADLGALIGAALERGLSGAEMIVVGSGGKTTPCEVVQLLAEGTHSNSPIHWSSSERPSFLIDSSKAGGLFGFSPMQVEQALLRFVRDNA
jgi:nucleoside-diphosphate-sugar epimerase